MLGGRDHTLHVGVSVMPAADDDARGRLVWLRAGLRLDQQTFTRITGGTSSSVRFLPRISLYSGKAKWRPGSPDDHAVAAALPVEDRIVGIDQKVPLLDGACALRQLRQRGQHARPAGSAGHGQQLHALVFVGASRHGLQEPVATQAYDDAREIVADFVGANRDDHTVIFGKNTTEAINKLSYRFPFAAEMWCWSSLMEHH